MRFYENHLLMLEELIAAIIEMASAGYAEESLDELTQLIVNLNLESFTTKLRTLLGEETYFVLDERFIGIEPLIIGLRIFLGEERPLVAQEVFEVGKDIADRIRSKQVELLTLLRKGVEIADMN
jgi:hypothetical protein